MSFMRLNPRVATIQSSRAALKTISSIGLVRTYCHRQTRLSQNESLSNASTRSVSEKTRKTSTQDLAAFPTRVVTAQC